jgi:hypothetical protein
MPIEFDKKAKRYRDSRGRFVSRQSVRDAVDNAGKAFKREAGKMAEQLDRGEITGGEWRNDMAALVKRHLIVTSSIGKGGHKQMTRSDWGSVGGNIRREQHYLAKFADELDRLSPRQIAARARQYAGAGHIAFERMTERLQMGKEAKRFLHASESCSGCLSYAGRWMPVAEMPSIGSLKCRHRCRCHIEYR